jgi:DNA-binding NtrC family response regulator
MPGANGAWLFAEVREAWPELPVFVLAADGTVDAAVDAVRRGAADFAVRPVHAGELAHRCARVFRERALRDENAELKERIQGGDGAPGRDEGGEDRLVERLMASEISFEEFEREILVRALGRTRGNQSRAARMLGMTRRTLQYRIEKFDIDTASMRA